MRRHYLTWMIAVFGIVGTVYGAYTVIWHSLHGNGLNVPGLILFIFGIVALAFFLAWAISVFRAKRKANNQNPFEKVEEEAKPEQVAEPKEEKPVPPAPKEKPKPEPEPELEPEPEPESDDEKEEEVSYEPRIQRSYVSPSPSYASTAYVKLVGYGPLLRVEGSRILDMRNSTYFRIDGDTVYQDGYGLRFEIRGNQIRDAFGGYLFELNGSAIHKAFGGFYAAVSGNYITLYDGSAKYEMTDSLSKKQILVVAALLFDNR